MFNWAKQQLANVAGTQEPIYGASAIKSVAQETAETPYTELTRDDFKWTGMDSTSVETQTFYFMAKGGDLGVAQVIYSNVAGIHITCQFTAKIFSRDPAKPHLWSSTMLENAEFSEDKTSFYADSCAVELSEDGTSYTIKSLVDEKCVVNLKVTRTSPGLHAGKTGRSLFGTDPEKPWGSMRHAFWPRCVAEGTMTTPDGAIDFEGRAFYVHALMGMKPHHAAAKWNFANFQGDDYTAMIMEFTTPPSYGSTKVTIGAIAKDGEVVVANCDSTAVHVKVEGDELNDWPVPSEIKYTWSGKTKDGKDLEATLEAVVGQSSDRVDVMAEVPGFVKAIVATAAGTKPYVYQYNPSNKQTLKIKTGEEETTEAGKLFAEATFISK
ncbi:probable Survival factor 1 [Cephalotrichum gorgonifer]|uniref:Probable Survival factor 1 n=1 Tax=Cephalotrichum gorgonifer TaxID=2041049 RepID=A0AAE8SSQ1_9PEZI|nr:probable Survival factor 1 [Cephalotrichum gorgonifer]